MKIAVVRGPSLNKFEMQSYEPLAKKHEVVCFGSTKPLYEISDIRLPKILLPCLGQYFSLIPGGIRLLYQLIGDSQLLMGLENQISGFDVVHTAETASYYTHQALKAKKRGLVKKVVVTVWENIPFNQENSPRQKQLKEYAMENVDYFLAASEGAKEALITEGCDGKKISVIWPGIDLKVFKPKSREAVLARKFDIKANDFVVLSVGRLVWEKGFYDLIWAVWELKKSRPESKLKFLVVGEGPEKNKLINMVGMLGLKELFVFPGNFPYDKMVAVYNLANVFVLASIPTKTWQEQFGIVLIEAMACGLPVIATRTGAIPEVVGNSGLMVAANDWIGMAEVLGQAIKKRDQLEEMGDRGLTRAKNFFNNFDQAKKIEKVYQGVLEV